MAAGGSSLEEPGSSQLRISSTPAPTESPGTSREPGGTKGEPRENQKEPQRTSRIWIPSASSTPDSVLPSVSPATGGCNWPVFLLLLPRFIVTDSRIISSQRPRLLHDAGSKYGLINLLCSDLFQ